MLWNYFLLVIFFFENTALNWGSSSAIRVLAIQAKKTQVLLMQDINKCPVIKVVHV